MKKLLLVLLVFSGVNSVFSQSISDITITSDAKKIAYLKNGDSLFIDNLNSISNEILVDIGLNDNGNNRFLIWTRDNRNLVYEKDNSLKIFDLEKGISKTIDHAFKDSIALFKFYLINQVGISNDNELYFSAGTNDSGNQLFKLDVEHETIIKLSTDTLHVSNVSVSKNGEYIAYASYDIGKTWKSKLTILRVTDNSFVSETKLMDNTFIFGLDWSPDGSSIFTRNARGSGKVFNFSIDKEAFTETDIPLKNGQKALQYYDNHHLITVQSDLSSKTYGLLDTRNGETKIIISDKGISFIGVVIDKNGKGSLFFTKQNRIQPIVLLEAEVTTTDVENSIVHKFIRNNPLSKFSYTTHLYKNGSEKNSSSYIYHTKGHFSDSTKFHPLLIVSYGGFKDKFPKFDYFLYEQLFSLLDDGFLIAFLNTRGIQEERQLNEYGKLQLMDTQLFVEDITNKFNVNRDSVYVIGHSHGATMVYYYMTHSELFAGGIAVNGAADWIKQAELKAMSGLPWGMGGEPNELPDLYTEYSPIENLENLNKPMLTFAGKKDTQIHSDINAEAFYAKAKLMNKDIKLRVFQDEGHLIKNGKNRNIFWDETIKFLNGGH